MAGKGKNKADEEQSAWSIGGGDEGDRTLDLGIANAALSQLSYVPGGENYSHPALRRKLSFFVATKLIARCYRRPG